MASPDALLSGLSVLIAEANALPLATDGDWKRVIDVVRDLNRTIMALPLSANVIATTSVVCPAYRPAAEMLGTAAGHWAKRGYLIG